MKLFIKNIITFLLPFLLVFIALELFLTFSVNTFNSKSRYLKNNLESIEVLILGSSHFQDAINPSYISLKTANLAYGGQDRHMDASLFTKYAPQMSKLKVVILEVDFTTFNNRTPSNYFRLPWYYRFYGLETHNVNFLKKISLYASSPSFFNNYLYMKLSPNSYKYEINIYGSIENDFPGVFKTYSYNAKALEENYKIEASRLKEKQSDINFQFNRDKLESILSYCKENKIDVVFSETPIYIEDKDYLNKIINEKYKLILSNLIKNYSIERINYKGKLSFNINDFKNFTHLNSDGAKKFSLFLDTELNKLMSRSLD